MNIYLTILLNFGKVYTKDYGRHYVCNVSNIPSCTSCLQVRGCASPWTAAGMQLYGYMLINKVFILPYAV